MPPVQATAQMVASEGLIIKHVLALHVVLEDIPRDGVFGGTPAPVLGDPRCGTADLVESPQRRPECILGDLEILEMFLGPFLEQIVELGGEAYVPLCPMHDMLLAVLGEPLCPNRDVHPLQLRVAFSDGPEHLHALPAAICTPILPH